MVAKHRRSVPSHASVGPPGHSARPGRATSGREGVGYWPVAATVAPRAVHGGFGSDAGYDDRYGGGGYDDRYRNDGYDDRYRDEGYDDRYPRPAYYQGGGADPGWMADAEAHTMDDWQDWGPPPALHPDHPSAPVPRVQFPADHPSGPMRSPRAARGRGPASGRHEAATGTETVSYLAFTAGQVRRDVSGFQGQPAEVHHSGGYQRQARAGSHEATNYVPVTGPTGPRRGPAIEQVQDDSAPDDDSLWMAGQVLTLADDQAAEIAQEARDEAAAIREAAARDAAEIREAAEREAAEMRSRLNSMLDELGRMTAFLSETLADPVVAANAPKLSAANAQAMLEAAPSMLATAPAMPRTVPARPRPARPATRPAAPSARPTAKPAGRQAKAMRKFVAAFAVVSVIGAVAGVGELALHGLPFFLFRANGAGASEVGPKEPSNPPRAGQPFLPGAHSAHQPAKSK